MFESAENGNKIGRKEYEHALDDLRVELLNAQFDLQQAPFSVLVLLMGVDRWGVDDVVSVLHEWMDARHIDTHFFGRVTEQERERPRFWRYWQALPSDGEIGLHIGAWALGALADRLDGEIDDARLEQRIGQVRRFERALSDRGTLVIKFWCHLSKKEYEKRLKKARKNPELEPYLEKSDWKRCEALDDLLPFAERFIGRTSTSDAPWHVIESTDFRYRNLTIAQTLLASIRARLEAPEPPPSAKAPAVPRARKGVLDTVDLTSALDKEAYKSELQTQQARLHQLVRKAWKKNVSTVLVFEGWDAAGKGGAIRRLTRALSARDYRVIPVAAPTDEENAYHYLWRFWRQLPRDGQMAIFDRSWYGRVLVERVEGFARDDEWQRAYQEIVDFESQLAEHGAVVHKFWLHISQDDQLARFQAREKTPYKKYKITDDDYRNRDKWDDYVDAVEEMVTRTSTDSCPWTVVPASDKKFARVEVLKTVCKALERRLG